MEYTDKMKNRLKRIEGQARGVLRMMDEGKECADVIHQMTALRSAVDHMIAYVIGNHMEQCIRDNVLNGIDNEKTIHEAIQLLTKSR